MKSPSNILKYADDKNSLTMVMNCSSFVLMAKMIFLFCHCLSFLLESVKTQKHSKEYKKVINEQPVDTDKTGVQKFCF